MGMIAIATVVACAPIIPPQPIQPPGPPHDVLAPTDPPAATSAAPLPEIASESPSPGGAGGFTPVAAPDLDRLRSLEMIIPVKGSQRPKIEDSFDAPRDGGRRHDAIDILAPRGTPILAAVGGTIMRVGSNALGGNTVWIVDAEQRFAFYYAHLDRYAKIKQGTTAARGTVLGYVGTTGNAPPDVPHLHFQVMRISDPKRWWDGTPVNPFPFLMDASPIVEVGAKAP
jgi:murein DD-endopeptidase MepM/ murein hydrolase activator NlpD